MVSLAIGFYLKGKKKYFIQIIALGGTELSADKSITFSTVHGFTPLTISRLKQPYQGGSQRDDGGSVSRFGFCLQLLKNNCPKLDGQAALSPVEENTTSLKWDAAFLTPTVLDIYVWLSHTELYNQWWVGGQISLTLTEALVINSMAGKGQASSCQPEHSS